MKALSIKQPWANMIANGEKTIETRKWPTNYRGPLLIVSSKAPPIKPAGFALAVARVADCRPMTKEDEAAACCPVYPGAFSWVLEDVQKIEPFPVKGSLGIYEVDVEPDTLQSESDSDHMKEGTILHYSLGAAGVTQVQGDQEEFGVGMNEFGASRNSAVPLVAAGGPCPIIVLWRPEIRAGAVIHVSGENAEHDGADHEQLLARLLVAAPELKAPTHACICFDPEPTPGFGLPEDMDADDTAAQAAARIAYAQKLEQYLQSLGYADIAQITSGSGKTVHLNTADGYVIFTDKDENFLHPPGAAWLPA